MRVQSAFLLAVILVSLAPAGEAQSGSPILVTNDNFTGFPGKGTSADPYIISGLDITAADAHGIELNKTTKHVIIRDVSIVAGGSTYDGIRLVDATNVVIERADLQFNRNGITLLRSNGTIVRESTVRTSQVGILIEGTRAARIEGNSLSVNEQDIALRTNGGGRTAIYNATKNVFRDNKLSIATGQWGFHFQSTANYDNDIDDSNVVNFEKVRWHTNVVGNAASPVTFSNEQAQIRGATNVGQIVCYNCSYVRFDRANVTAGAASGLVIERSSNVTVARAFAEGNANAGIEVRNSSRIGITDPSAYANVVGIFTLNASNVSIASAVLAANERGVRILHGNGTTIRSSSIENNTAVGVLLDHTNRSSLEKNTYRSNAGEGLHIFGGAQNSAREETAASNGGAGILVEDAVNATITASRVEGNGEGGIVLTEDTLLSNVVGNRVSGNEEGGIWLRGAGAVNFVDGNELTSQPKHIRISASEQNSFERNTMSTGPNETGFWFDDEPAYNNNISTTNKVNGTSVQWHVALVGSSNSPIALRNVRVETPNMTNVAQIMIYKGSYVRLIDAAASGGPRGIYVLRSSSFGVDGATLSANDVGIDLSGAQTGDIKRVRTEGGSTGVLLRSTINVTVADIAAPGAKVAVRFSDTTARGSVVERIDATGTLQASVIDPTASTREPRHLIADAGLDKLAGVGQNITFNDTLGVARFGSERILRQTWDFGDETTETSSEMATLRPTHAYAAAGNYTAKYSLETADGRKLADTVQVVILEPPAAPTGLVAKADAAKRRVQLNWSAPESEAPILSYRVYRGTSPANLTLLEESATNSSFLSENFRTATNVYYAVAAVTVAGEGDRSEPVRVRIEPVVKGEDNDTTATTPTAKGAPLGGVWLIAAALAVALVLRRRLR